MRTESDRVVAEELVRDSMKKFPDMPCVKRVYRNKKTSFHWSAARKKERFSSR